MPFAAAFRIRCMFVLSFVFGTFAVDYLIRFQLSRLFLNKAWCLQLFTFVPRNLCVKHYASLCIFMQSKNVYLYNIMINRKLWGIFGVSLACLRKRPIFLLFVFSLFLLFGLFRRKQKQKRKIRFFAVFCLKTSVFVANKTLIFSDLWLYRANYTPYPVFGTRRVGQLSSKNFLFFYFLFFVKYYDFANSAFLLNF